jgi:UDP-N-acetylglucosamine--N-acetylmuramyl-(pentapeptide) pyrophosphoryl-undecaprenol N-acetylglucosamine transferase
MRVLMADGGTGGHIFPALTVADELRKRDPNGAILFTGTAAGLEQDLVPRHGYQLRMIQVGGLIGKGLITKIKTLLQLPMAYLQSRKILSEFNPDLVIGYGAYASGPVLVAAHHKKIPILLVEPNAIPGFTNRRTLRYAKFIAVPYEDRSGIFQGKAVVTGNPVRQIRARKLQNEKFTIGIFGGSQGARAINQTIVSLLPELAARKEKLHMIHQTGKANFDEIRKEYETVAPFYEVTPFIYDVEKFYNRADLLICRSGAITLAEITALGKPSILIPLPTAAHNHQEANARRLMEAGAARMILQKDLTAESLLTTIREFMDSPEMLKRMADASKAMGRPDAANHVVELANRIAGQQAISPIRPQDPSHGVTAEDAGAATQERT